MFRKFYYWKYYFFSRVKTNNATEFGACLYIIMLMCCNIATIILLLCSLTLTDSPKSNYIRNILHEIVKEKIIVSKARLYFLSR